MTPFPLLDVVALPIARANVDTDQIVPARYLKKPRSEDFGQYLFQDLRHRPDGTPERAFPLNNPRFQPARIVVSGRNFGCGSSREHAVWALYDYGIRAVIAESFGDIFHTNALKNGLLPIVLEAGVVATLLDELRQSPGARIAIDLGAQTVVSASATVHAFEIDPFSKRCLQEGLDELAFTLSQMDAIVAFERDYERGARFER